eukprot:GHVU01008208.1.p2 GENE.GHVU01008208.1~~GHVU01008208.1.p2  ORF type:complete len:108 (+),score=11.69 GHVU01008208.1:143-466(+)
MWLDPETARHRVPTYMGYRHNGYSGCGGRTEGAADGCERSHSIGRNTQTRRRAVAQSRGRRRLVGMGEEPHLDEKENIIYIYTYFNKKGIAASACATTVVTGLPPDH